MIQLESIEVAMAMDEASIRENIEKTRRRGHTMAHDLPEWRDQMPIALVGGGPSLASTIEEAKRFKNVMLCGSVHDHAIKQGAEPRWAVICDPDPIMASYLSRPLASCRYLVASHCADEVFRALKGCDVAVWHCGGALDTVDPIWDERTILIGGGCTVGLRAIILAATFGYRDIHLFGMDTCMDGERHHAYEFNSPEEEYLCTKGVTEVRIGSESGKPFVMSGYHIGQMVGFQEILKSYSDKLKFTVHGGGVLAELLRLGREKAALSAA